MQGGLQPLGDIVYRLAENDALDGPAFCRLYNHFYSKHADMAYYQSHLFDTPFPSLMCVAAANGDAPIGFYGLHVLEGNINGALTA